jgi:glycerate dehydrogenase
MNGKTFGIIGLGSIGSKIAEIASSFGANVIYWSITRKKKYEERGIKYKELDCPP